MRRAIVLVIFLLLFSACVPTTNEDGEALVIPTSSSQPVADATETSPALPPAIIVTPIFTPDVAATGNVDSNQDGTTTYGVVFVAEDDVLNVRSGPGVENGILGELAPDATNIHIDGTGQEMDRSTWVPISAAGVTGWVNGRFLTQVVNPDRFCQDDAVLLLLEGLKSGIDDQDSGRVAELIHPERGLRLHHSWWNPAVHLKGDDINGLFESDTDFDWGVEDGSGASIEGSFREIILPLLEQDLLAATETACNDILHGGTAGIIQLPDGYHQIGFYSFHRPGTDEFSGMDWGSWVVGVEKWQGRYYLSFMVHFAWEI